MFRFDGFLRSSIFSIINAHLDARKFAFVMRTYCSPDIGCRSASPRASARRALISLKFSTINSEMVILAPAFES